MLFLKHAMIRYAVMLLSATCVAPVVHAKAPLPIKTLAQMSLEQGSDPDYREPGSKYTNMAQGIPRDFPVPADSSNLHYSNVMTAASISGTPQQAKAFYEDGVFKTQNWTVTDHSYMTYKGQIEYNIIACKLQQCVNLSSANDDPYHKNTIKFTFFKK